MNLIDSIRASAIQRDQLQLRRHRRVQQQRDGAHAVVDGQRLLNFSSNDYLGFAQHPAVRAAFIKGIERFGVGSAGSALVSGYFSAHADLEQQAAALFGYEACLYVGSGYLANIGVLQTLLDEKSVCVQDKRNHACLIDGARFAGCTLMRYAHADLQHAERLCTQAAGGNVFIVSDGVFSMDGDSADLRALSALARQQAATLMIDDAHGIGVLGSTGLGSLQSSGLCASDVPLLIIPAGKALGGHGALILSSNEIIQHLLETARPYLFSTAPAPAMAAGLSEALNLLVRAPEYHQQLQTNIAAFKQLAQQAALPVMPSSSAIQPVMAGSNARALQLAKTLRARGYWLSAIRPPTVPAGKARLRITLTALHTPDQIEQLVSALAAALEELHDPAS
jgi:8-amino-7-oxononanoate synthase